MKKSLLFTFIISLSVCAFSQKAEVAAKDSLIVAYLEEVNADSVISYIQALEDMETRFMMSPLRKQRAEWIKSKFESFGYTEVRIDSTWCDTYINYGNLHYDTATWQYNVVATLPGLISDYGYFVMGAHWDDVVHPAGDPMVLAPGADDNASGVAALFEVARVFRLKNYQPLESIEFVAFGAEELMYFGNSGAQGYVSQAVAQAKNILFMVNNDMIGYSTGATNWELTISNYTGSEWFSNIAKYVAQTFTDMTPVLLNPSTGGEGDCLYFVQEGVPAVYFMEADFNPYYHTVQDLTSNCNAAYCAEAVRVSLGLLMKAIDYFVGTDEHGHIPAISYYPNPASDVLFIDAGAWTGSSLSFEITDILGKVLAAETIDRPGRRSIGVDRLPEGTYVLRINTGDYLRSHLFMIKR